MKLNNLAVIFASPVIAPAPPLLDVCKARAPFPQKTEKPLKYLIVLKNVYYLLKYNYLIVLID